MAGTVIGIIPGLPSFFISRHPAANSPGGKLLGEGGCFFFGNNVIAPGVVNIRPSKRPSPKDSHEWHGPVYWKMLFNFNSTSADLLNAGLLTVAVCTVRLSSVVFLFFDVRVQHK